MAFRHTYSCQTLDDEDYQSVLDVLTSTFLTQGPKVDEFELAIATMTRSEYAVATNSATAGLHLALAALDVDENDWVWTTPNTFVATVNTALMRKARVKLIDIDSQTYNLDLKKLEANLIDAASQGCLPKVVVVVHFAGNPIDLTQLETLQKKFGFEIVEDGSHALGASTPDGPIGSCKFSAACVFSFHAVKPITTGEGGAITTNRPAMKETLVRMRSHGIERPKNGQHANWFYNQVSEGWNYRMPDINAALGISQLKKNHRFIKRRSDLLKQYQDRLVNHSVRFQQVIKGSSSTWHLCVVGFDSNTTRDRVNKRLQDARIGTNFHYIPVYRHSFHHCLGLPDEFPNMEHYYSTSLTIPLHAKLSNQDIQEISHEIIQAI